MFESHLSDSQTRFNNYIKQPEKKFSGNSKHVQYISILQNI